MIPDDSIVLSGKIAVLRYLAEKGDGVSVSLDAKSMSDYIIEASQYALPAKMRAARRYAAKGEYAYGLPTASSISVEGVDITNVVKQVIEADLGHSVDMVYAFIGDANYQHFLWKKLIEKHGYNPTTNELTTLSAVKGFPCYLDTAQLTYGKATVELYEDLKALDLHGFSVESGQSIGRVQDLSRLPIDAEVDTLVNDAYADITYKYLEIIPDITPPPSPVINSLTPTTIGGYAEIGGSVKFYISGVLQYTVTANSTGYFSYTFPSTLANGTVVNTVVVDAANNQSSVVAATVPYTNPTPATQGTPATITQVVHTESFTFDFLDYIPTAVVTEAADSGSGGDYGGTVDARIENDYIQACYTFSSGGVTQIRYFTYVYGSGSIASLDNAFTTGAAFGEFFPRLYARLDGQDLVNTLSKYSDEYKSSKRMAKILGIDWEDWSKSLHDSIDSVGDVQQLFITLAAPMNTEDKETQEYLYHYWTAMYNQLDVPSTLPKLVALNAKAGKTIEVKDNVYSHIVSFKAVSINDVVGSIGAVGTFASGYLNTDKEVVKSIITPSSGGGTSKFKYLTIKSQVEDAGFPSHHYYRYQDTPTSYKEVLVFLASSTHSFSGKSTTALGDDENLVIPLDNAVLPKMTNNEKEILFAKCMHLFINVKKVIKVKWYQRGAFKVVMAVVAVAISIAFPPAGVAAFSLTSVLTAVGTSILIGAAVNMVITLLVKLGVSPELAGALAVVAAIYSGYLAVEGTTGVLNMTASEVLKYSSYAMDMSAKASAYQMQQLQKDIDAFGEMAKEKEKELQQAKELAYNQVIDMDLELILADGRSRVFVTLGESVQDFLNRSPLNTTQTTLSYISNYVDLQLQPPSLNEILQQLQRSLNNGSDISL